MPTTAKGFPYPENSSATNVPSDLQGLAQAVNDIASAPTVLTTKGDLAVGNGTSLGRLPVGSNGQTLTVGATSPVWVSPSDNKVTPIAYTSLGVDTASVTFSGVDAYDALQIVVAARSNLAALQFDRLLMRFNSDATAANYWSSLMLCSPNGSTTVGSGYDTNVAAYAPQGTSGSATGITAGIIPAALATTGYVGGCIIDISAPAGTSPTGLRQSRSTGYAEGSPVSVNFYSQGPTTTNAQLHTTTNHGLGSLDGATATGFTHADTWNTGGRVSNSTNLSNKVATTTVATITTSTGHGMEVGDVVTIASSPADATIDGARTVTGIPSQTTFTFARSGTAITSVAITGSVTNPRMARMFINVASATVTRTASNGSTILTPRMWFSAAGRRGVSSTITSITLLPVGGTAFVAGSTFSLYGIARS